MPEMRVSMPGMALHMQCTYLEKFQVIRWNLWQSTCRAIFSISAASVAMQAPDACEAWLCTCCQTRREA